MEENHDSHIALQSKLSQKLYYIYLCSLHNDSRLSIYILLHNMKEINTLESLIGGQNTTLHVSANYTIDLSACIGLDCKLMC